MKQDHQGSAGQLDRMGRDELHYAALGNDVQTVRSRLSAGVPASLAEKQAGWTPLHFAAQDGSFEAARELIVAGAEIDARSKTGQTPLWIAVMHYAKDPRIIRLLVEHGADPNAKDVRGQSPRDVAETQHAFPTELLGIGVNKPAARPED